MLEEIITPISSSNFVNPFPQHDNFLKSKNSTNLTILSHPTNIQTNQFLYSTGIELLGEKEEKQKKAARLLNSSEITLISMQIRHAFA